MLQGFLALIVLFLFGFAIALRALWGFEHEDDEFPAPVRC
jgi:hypothetical protein